MMAMLLRSEYSLDAKRDARSADRKLDMRNCSVGGTEKCRGTVGFSQETNESCGRVLLSLLSLQILPVAV